MAKPPLDLSQFKIETRLALAGRNHARSEGAVNPAVQRATTLVFDDPDDLYGKPHKTYALEGMAVQEALRDALVAIEGGAGATLAPSGLGACTLALLTMAREGGEMLVTDNAYGPTRRFCDTMLARLGVRTVYFDPHIGSGIDALMTERTCGVFMETPGSGTFELHDVPAIAAAARAREIPTAIDNTWSAGLYFKPFAHGVDLSVQALTKYQAGHSDTFMGAVLSSTPAWETRVRLAYKQLGLGAAPDDAYLVLRGLRTMGVRLERQSASALQIARWLEAHPQVSRVRHPALESHPDHAIWKRDFTGASGLFAFELKTSAPERVNAMLQALQIFAMGFSWGGYESLIVPVNANIKRTATSFTPAGETIRVSIGVEHPDDLIADLSRGLAALG